MGRRSAHAGGGPSQRQLRVGEELRHVLAELLMRGGLRAPALAEAQLTVSEVRVSADLRHAVVFVTELGGELQRRAAGGARARRRRSCAVRSPAGCD